jgi:uncharacterized membrane protein YidH (DUF202 family)
MPKFCPACGLPLQYENAVICPNCGARTAVALEEWKEIRNPLLAIVFCFLFPGWGQWYNGKTWDGMQFFGAFWASWVVMFIFSRMVSTQTFTAIYVTLFIVIIAIWIYGMYDAYKTAERINRRKDSFSGKSRLFWLPVALFVVAIVLIIVAFISAFVFGMTNTIAQTKAVAVSVQQPDSNHVTVTYKGGPDAYLMKQLTVTVTDNAGNMQTKNIEQLSGQTIPLEVGSSVTFTGEFSRQNHVVASGAFSDGVQQVLLDTFV